MPVKTILRFCMAISILLTVSCSPQKEIAVEDPSPEAALWTGEWNVWVVRSADPEAAEVTFTADGNLIAGTVPLGNALSADFSAEAGVDGISALGTYESNEGLSDSVSMILSADGKQFSGYLHGISAVCGAREDAGKPDPCLSAFKSGWEGGWTVWIGPLEMEGNLFFDPNDESVGPLSYEVVLEASDDGAALVGKWMAVGSTGKLEALLLENGVQFHGRMDDRYPFCGVRPGGPKPETCLMPKE